jgi:hypothetical protein
MAVCCLHDDAARRDLRTTDQSAFRQYAIEKALSWYDKASLILHKKGRSRSLLLVTGCDKASSWTIASHSLPQLHTKKGIPMWHHAVSEIGADNHCLFIRGFKVEVKEYYSMVFWRRRSVEVTSITDSTLGDLLPTDATQTARSALPTLRNFVNHCASHPGSMNLVQS